MSQHDRVPHPREYQDAGSKHDMEYLPEDENTMYTPRVHVTRFRDITDVV
jgi:hypothetical protein